MSLDLRSIGNKLLRCRQQLQLNLIDVAEGTGIISDRISLIESGGTEATGDEILIFADFYKQDYNFFISNQKLSASEQVDVLYRRFGNSFSKEDRWVIQEFIYLCECEQFLWEQLDKNVSKFHFTPVGNYYKGHGEQGAKAFRTFLGYSPNEIINDIYSEVRKSQIHVFRRRLKNSDISGLFINHPYAGKCILVNYEEDIYRQNFTLSHELGHAIFDFNNNINISFQSDWKNSDYIELRANTFASNFLIPKEALISLGIHEWTQEIILSAAKKLRVNVKPLLISLKEIKLIDQNEFLKLEKLKIPISEKEDPEIRNLTPKRKEAKIQLLERGLSAFYVHTCYAAYEAGIITERRMAEMLLTNELELPLILALFSLKLSHGD